MSPTRLLTRKMDHGSRWLRLKETRNVTLNAAIILIFRSMEYLLHAGTTGKQRLMQECTLTEWTGRGIEPRSPGCKPSVFPLDEPPMSFN